MKERGLKLVWRTKDMMEMHRAGKLESMSLEVKTSYAWICSL
jgi:hypothetical protein